MSDLQNALKADFGIEMAESFVRCAYYYSEMDCINYLSSDQIAIADRVDQFLTVLWDENLENLVGFKLKGFRYIFTEHLLPLKHINEHDFNPIIRALEFVFTSVGESLIPQDRRKDVYRNVIDFVHREEVHLETGELQELAA